MSGERRCDFQVVSSSRATYKSALRPCFLGTICFFVICLERAVFLFMNKPRSRAITPGSSNSNKPTSFMLMDEEKKCEPPCPVAMHVRRVSDDPIGLVQIKRTS